MDTDVEVIKPLHRFLVHEAFSGFEDHQFLQSGTMGAVKHHPWIGELLQYYADRPFLLQGGDVFDLTTNTAIMSRISQKHGLKLNGQHQTLPGGVVFYPRWFFSPYDYINGGNYINDDSLHDPPFCPIVASCPCPRKELHQAQSKPLDRCGEHCKA